MIQFSTILFQLSEEIQPKANSETHTSTSVSDTSISNNEDTNHIHDAIVHVEDTVSTFSRIDSGIVNL